MKRTDGAATRESLEPRDERSTAAVRLGFTPMSAEQAKPTGYYGNDRADLVAALPRPIGRVLDVGCGAGRRRPRAARRGRDVARRDRDRARGRRARRASATTRSRSAPSRRPARPLDGAVRHDPAATTCSSTWCDPYAVLRRLPRRRGAGRAAARLGAERAPRLARARPRPVAGRSATRSGATATRTHLRWFTRARHRRGDRRGRLGGSSTSHPALQRSRARSTGSRAGRSTEFLVGQWYVLAVKPRR